MLRTIFRFALLALGLLAWGLLAWGLMLAVTDHTALRFYR